jgi:hypothetical protein
MRNQRRVVIGEDRALLLKEIQQVGHLFEVGRHVRIIAAQMHIVELDIDYVLDAVGEMALRGGRCGVGWPAYDEREQPRKRDEQMWPH